MLLRPIVRIFKAGLLCCALILALLLGLFGAMQIQSIRNNALAQLTSLIAKQTGWNVSLHSIIEITPFHWRLEGITLQRADTPSIAIESLEITLEANQLMLGRLSFAQTQAIGVQFSEVPKVDISGTVTLVPFKRKAHTQITLFPSHSPTTPTDLDLTARLRRGQMILDLNLIEDSKGLLHHLAGSDLTLPLRLQTLTYLDLEKPEGALHGQVEVHIRQLPKELQEFLGSHLTASGAVSWRDGVLSIEHLSARTPIANLAGHISLEGTQIGSNSFKIELSSLAPLQPYISLPLQGKVTAEGDLAGTVTSPNLFLDLSSEEVKLGEHTLHHIAIQLESQIRADNIQCTTAIWCQHELFVASSSFDMVWKYDQNLAFHNFYLHLPHTAFQGDLAFDLDTGRLNGSLEGDIPDLCSWSHSWQAPIAGRASIKAQLGEASSLQVEARDFQIGQEFKGESLSLAIAFDDIFTRTIQKIDLTAKKLVRDSVRLHDVSFHSTQTPVGSEWPFTVTANGDWVGPFSLTVNGTSQVSAGAQTISIRRLVGRLREESLAMESLLEITSQDSQISVKPFRLRWGQGLMEGHGTYLPDELNIALKLQNIALDIAGPLFTAVPIQGVLSGDGTITGRADNPEMHWKLTGDKVSIANRTLSLIPPLNTSVTVDARDHRLAMRGEIVGLGQQPLQVVADLPVTLTLGAHSSAQIERSKPMSASLQASGEISPILETILPGVTHLTGYANIALKVQGTINQPTIGGLLDFSNCTFDSLETGCILKNIRARFEAQGDRLVVKEFSASDGEKGTITGTGVAQLDTAVGALYDLNFLLDNVVLVRRDFVKGAGSGRLQLKGQGANAIATGEITTTLLDITIPQDSPASVTAIDVTFVNRPPGKRKPVLQPKVDHPIQLDVTIKVPDNAQIHSPELSSQWRGEIALKGHTEAVRAMGEWKLTQGEYKLNGRPYVLSKGKISFAGDVENDTTFSVVASQEIDSGLIEAVVRGSLRAPTLSLRANPPMPQREILSWMLFGRGVSEASPFETSQLNQLALNLPSSSGKSSKPSVLNRLQKLGIDRINIDSYDDGVQNNVSVNIGKYLAKGLYISLNKGVNSEKNGVSVEADVLRNVKLKGEVSDDAASKMLLMWRHDY